MKRLCLVVVMIFTSFMHTTAFAHKIRLFASVEGQSITGMLYLSDGKRVKHQRVVAHTAEGQMLGEVQTDDRGEFRLPVTVLVDHHLSADLGDGHRAEFVIQAAELKPLADSPALSPALSPTDSPADSPSASVARETVSEASVNPEIGPSATDHESVSINLSKKELHQLIDEALSVQLRSLRQQLDQYEDKIRWHDVLGGLGYLFGLAGVAHYLLSRRSSG